MQAIRDVGVDAEQLFELQYLVRNDGRNTLAIHGELQIIIFELT